MNNDKMKIAIFEVILLGALFILLFCQDFLSDYLIAGIMVAFAVVSRVAVRKVEVKSPRSKDATLLMVILAGLYIGGFYLLGVLANSLSNNVYHLNFYTLQNYLLPYSAIIISSEFIRHHFIAAELNIRRKGKTYNLSTPIMFICMVLVDVLVYIRTYNLSNYDDFRMAICLVLFSSVSLNLLYNYTARRYGMAGNTAYRLITTLYCYVFPVVPDLYIYLRAFLRLVFPVIVYLVLDRALAPREYAVAVSSKRRSMIIGGLVASFMVAFTMLVSCKFKYGALVIATDSMTGTLDRGTAVVYESYDNQEIQQGQIILFSKDGVIIVHRVVKVEETANGPHYITKGDANPNNDADYVTNDDIMGLAQFGVAYVGWPTLWVRSLFNA